MKSLYIPDISTLYHHSFKMYKCYDGEVILTVRYSGLLVLPGSYNSRSVCHLGHHTGSWLIQSHLDITCSCGGLSRVESDNDHTYEHVCEGFRSALLVLMLIFSIQLFILIHIL